MNEDIPETKLKRSLVGSHIAVKVGGEALKYAIRKPFLSETRKDLEREILDKRSAEILFKGLSLLKGTALKIAQMISMEMDLFPEAVRQELEKSYNRVPPINQVLIRRAVKNSLGQYPEAFFETFDLKAFAAASLGQVHHASTKKKEKIAVKVQYPGIDKTIRNDLQLVKNLFRPLPDYKRIRPAVEEIESRLLEETDYRKEAAHLNYFKKHLKVTSVVIPDNYRELSSKTVLSNTFLDGPTLDIWIKQNPGQRERDRIAQILNDLFLKSLYELKVIHADPNPGNFIILNHHRIGLLDFGCVKTFDPEFIALYRRLPLAIIRGEKELYFSILRQLGLTDSGLDKTAEDQIFKVVYRGGKWFGQLYREELFDFNKNRTFLAEGRALTNEIFKLRRYFTLSPDLVFLDRTRYGFLRLFESLRARVRIRNAYEWED